MPLPEKRIYTIEDIYNLPEGTRAELIDGQIYYMAPPSTLHQRISFALSRAIADHIDRQGGPCEVFPAPFAVFLQSDAPGCGENYLEPDLSIICDPEKIDEKGCHGAPDWIIEIVSPGSKRQDYYTKLALYRAAGVREYWIVDPARHAVIVYDMEHDEGPALYTFADQITVNIFGDLRLDLGKLNLTM